MRNLSKDRLFFVIKTMNICLVCLLLLQISVFASFYHPPTSDYTDSASNLPIIVPSNNQNIDSAINRAPIDETVKREKKGKTSINPFYKNPYVMDQNVPYASSDFSSIDAPLINYFKSELAMSSSLANYHEENYIYSSGQHGISNYNGILNHVIKDFDGDNFPEMAIFKIKTDIIDEFSTKEITVDMIKIVNNIPIKVDEIVFSADQYIGEALECSISIKYVNERWRIFLNYYEKKVSDNSYENKVVVLEYSDVFNVVANVYFTGNEDEQNIDFEKQNEIMDAGVDIRDDMEIFKRCFINDDPLMIPLFTIKRVNEKIRNNNFDELFNQVGFEDEFGEFRKVRYGYTQFLDRTKGI